MNPEAASPKPASGIAIDTGGTFTDAVRLVDGRIVDRLKVLSNGTLRGRVRRRTAPRRLEIDVSGRTPAIGLLRGFTLRCPGTGDSAEVRAHDDEGLIELDADLPLEPGTLVELAAPFDAPRLAIHLLLGGTEDDPKPLPSIRVATTRGTNALLENRGAPFALLLDTGLEDLLEIGDQTRPDLFALDIRRPRLAPDLVVGVGGRLDAAGRSLGGLEPAELDAVVERLRGSGIGTVAIALLHAWRDPERERVIARALLAAGLGPVICSTDLSGSEGLLARAETGAVEATLAPILRRFLAEILPTDVRDDAPAPDLKVMTSAGGLVPAGDFHAKDSLLSGPAGGVTGAARAARACGLDALLGFDMGGTSTDVSRHDGDLIYRFETRVGPARIQAPCVAIESVAAGGGSICHVTDTGLAVGPRSAGASPGPACYGNGGPLTLTDVNLLLGRADPDHFELPLDLEASEAALDSLRSELVDRGLPDPGRIPVLSGLRDIADERMAEAMRAISVREGADPARHVLVPFGGAGGQHGCAIAERLGIETILVPTDAGLLSAIGLAHAREERFAERTIMRELRAFLPELEHTFAALTEEARERLGLGEAPVRRRLLALRLEGQDATIQLEHRADHDPAEAFAEAFERLYGYPPPDRPVEIVSLRVVVAEATAPGPHGERLETPNRRPTPERTRRMCCASGTREAPVHVRSELEPGSGIDGPALVQDAGATIVIEPGWFGLVQPDGALLLQRERRELIPGHELHGAEGAAGAELVAARLEAIATGMGRLLERTSLSVNVKQRLDFSCAILDAEARLLVNAPHLPVHLGSMGLCVREVLKTLQPEPGDVVVTNAPEHGGSHLPDVTTLAPVHERRDGGRLLGYVAVRAHHAEIGGTRPGSTPPDARCLAEEGVVIPPTVLLGSGRDRSAAIETLLRSSPHPSRRPEENLADLAAQVAATRHGVERIRNLAGATGPKRFGSLAARVHRAAAHAATEAVRSLGTLDRRVEQRLDDGTPIRLRVSTADDRLRIDFTGTAAEHPGNFNAPVAITTGASVYLMRLLAGRDLPMNEGLLEPVDLIIPPGLLAPRFTGDPARDPAVCAGNTETSQRVVDTLVRAFELGASSQGTMNNLLLGNDRFGYYETICGGAGATARAPGASCVHTHMTNTRITDPEILELRYPVRLERFARRRESGGVGRHAGGDGVIRCLRALEPLEISVVAQHRIERPGGMAGGGDGAPGLARVIRSDGTVETLPGCAAVRLEPGDRIEIETPGGGGWGEAVS